MAWLKDASIFLQLGTLFHFAAAYFQDEPAVVLVVLSADD
jgi:hypothetical protein